jgi:hypothetical protein
MQRLLDWIACFWPPPRLWFSGSWIAATLALSLLGKGLTQNIIGGFIHRRPTEDETPNSKP